MAKWRKKPVVIEATQWSGWEEGPHDLGIQHYPENNGFYANKGWISTLEGTHIVTPGDWIITGVKGEKYPCKPDIFEVTYDPA